MRRAGAEMDLDRDGTSRKSSDPRSDMKRTIVAGFVFLLALAAAADAARKDDFEFAQGLVGFKYYDLAQEQFEAIIRDTSRSAEDRANGELGLSLLKKARVLDIRNDPKVKPDEILAGFAEAEEGFEKFLSSYPTHPRQTDAKFEIGIMLQSKGSYLSDQKEKEPDRAAEYHKLAEDAYDDATDLFKGAADSMEQKLENLEEGTEQHQNLDWDARRARFFEAATHYNKGQLYAAGGAERTGTMERAIEKLTEFVWDNEENILGGYAYFYLGLACRDLARPDEAMEWFSTAFGYPVPDLKTDPDNYLKWTDLYLQSYWKLLEYCDELGVKDGRDYRDEGVKKAVEMLQRIPDILNRHYGHRSILSYARLLKNMNEPEKALSLATEISTKAESLMATETWAAGTNYLANQLINEIISEHGGNLSLPPDVLMKAALGRKSSQEWNEAIRSFQQVIAAAKGGEQLKQFSIPAWMQIGDCYLRAEKYLEAYYAFDSIVSAFLKVDEAEAGNAAYYRYRSATGLFAVTQDPFFEDLKKKARSSFAEQFPKHPKSIDLQYFEGADYIDDADAARSTGKEKAAEIYKIALERLGGVQKTSILHEKALARAGEVYYKTDDYKKALATFEAVRKFIEDPENVTTDPERKANRQQALAIGVYYSAMCHSRQKDPGKVLDVLKGFEKTFADENTKSWFPLVALARVQAYVERKMLPEAEPEALRMRTEFPDWAGTASAFFTVGNAFRQTADEAPDKATRGPIWRAALQKAADYMSWYMQHRERVTAEEWETIGGWYYLLQDWPHAEEALQKAIKLYNTRLDAIVGETPEKKEIVKKEDGISVMLSEIFISQGKFADAKAVFESLLIPDAGARARVMEILTMSEFPQKVLEELMKKIRAVPSIMYGLAKAYHKLMQRDDMVRGMTLVKILLKVDRSRMYTADWWKWHLLLHEIWLDYGMAFRDPQALKNIIEQHKSYTSLGVLQNSGLEKEFTAIKDKAQAALQEMGR
jgi:tetratricopeptide (TPR) repeat protein